MLETIRIGTTAGDEFLKKLKDRGALAQEDAETAVKAMISAVREKGDAALLAYTEKFDGVTLTAKTMAVTESEIAAAYEQVEERLLAAIRLSKQRIWDFHQKQKKSSWFNVADGAMLGQMIHPMETAGIYVPGGKASYPSSVLMNAIPARVAGVSKIIMVTPAGKDGQLPPATLVAAKEAGVDAVYKIGGAQAIAALAYGTETIPSADVIVGPGNIYVATAKKLVYGQVAIDSIAGPSEILILADDSAVPAFVAADMLSQAEHDEMASAILVTTSQTLASAVATELEKQTAESARKEIIEKSLMGYGGILLAGGREEAVRLANEFAPEHLEICMADSAWALGRIKNAGAIFIGNYTPEPLGDYMAGPNHVLPTGGTARFFSPLGVDVFMKKTSLLQFEKEAMLALADATICFAEAEGLSAHANSVRIRKQ